MLYPYANNKEPGNPNCQLPNARVDTLPTVLTWPAELKLQFAIFRALIIIQKIFPDADTR